MSNTSAILLGLVQGLTEFLPVSSSGHLTIFQSILGNTRDNILFDIVVHCGTLAATIIFFRNRIYALLVQGIKELRRGTTFSGPALRTIYYIIAATCVTGIIGVLFKDPLEDFFSRPDLVCLMLFVTGLILLATKLAEAGSLEADGMGWRRAMIIGLVQGIAIIPGISRSGSTISAALFLKIRRETAGEFSFLISIPSILGAVALKARDIGASSAFAWDTLVIGFAVSALVGLAALSILMRFIRKGQLWVFAPYCLLVGAFGYWIFQIKAVG